MTTGRARLTVVDDGEGGMVGRFTAAGREGDFAPAVTPLLRRLLEGGWVPLAELAMLAGLSVADAAVVVEELVAMQAATVRAGRR
ncbi:hypothetical protein AB0D83_36445 [Streptomyces decoyicus]|uniref:hypothetical protein n=1 Tax=Streptomyces decoyicus TaxID=249567 RepID=UPI0033C12C94